MTTPGDTDRPIPEVNVATTVAARAEGLVQVVDVREPNEWAEGQIPGAIHIPLNEVAARSRELDPARPVVTVCRSGRRSLDAAAALLDAGFTDVASLAGGMIAWREAGQPVQR